MIRFYEDSWYRFFPVQGILADLIIVFFFVVARFTAIGQFRYIKFWHGAESSRLILLCNLFVLQPRVVSVVSASLKPWSHVRIFFIKIGVSMNQRIENPSVFVRITIILSCFTFHLSDENVRKIGFFMEILVTTLALRPLTGATHERLARIWEETSLSSDYKMRKTSHVT